MDRSSASGSIVAAPKTPTGAPGRVRRGAKSRRPTQAERSSRTREAILAVATEEFAKKGHDGARVDEIAASAGLQKNLIYYYFGSKDGLFTAVLERTYETIRRSQNDLRIRELAPIEGMRQLVFLTARIWARFPEFQRLLHSENIHDGRHIRSSRTIPRMYDPLLDTINILLGRGVKSGVFRKGVDPIDLYISITSLSAHYLSHARTFEAIFRRKLMGRERLRQRMEHAADMVLRYLLAEPARP